MGFQLGGQEFDDAQINGETANEVQINGETVWSPMTVVENFEHNDIANEYGNDESNYHTVTSPTYDGTYAATTDSTGTGHMLREDTTNAPERGDEFGVRVWFDHDDEGVAFVYFASATWQFGGQEAYFARIEHGTANAQIMLGGRFGNGSQIIESEFWDESPGYGGQWNTLYVDFGHTNNSDITAKYFEGDYGQELASVTATNETDYNSGHYGFAMGVDTTDIYMDQLHIL